MGYWTSQMGCSFSFLFFFRFPNFFFFFLPFFPFNRWTSDLIILSIDEKWYINDNILLLPNTTFFVIILEDEE